MARRTRSWNPGDAANAYVRVLLSELGSVIGGLDEDHWARTRAYFKGRCAYTGEELGDGDVVREHAVPINREHCGLHAFGNVLPSSRAANTAKGRMHYRDFLQARGTKDALKRLKKIECFVDESGYREKIAKFGDLRPYLELQYRQIVVLAEANKDHVRSFVETEPEQPSPGPAAGPAHGGERKGKVRERRRPTLPLVLEPPEPRFKEELLAQKHAWITTYYRNGKSEVKPWNASRMTPASNVIGNLRARPEHRPAEWRKRGIVRVLVTIQQP